MCQTSLGCWTQCRVKKQHVRPNQKPRAEVSCTCLVIFHHFQDKRLAESGLCKPWLTVLSEVVLAGFYFGCSLRLSRFCGMLRLWDACRKVQEM